MEDILTTIVVIGAIIILLQVMIIISYWRRGSKYVAMEQIYRQRQAEIKAREGQRTYHLLADWNVDEDPQAQNGQTTLHELLDEEDHEDPKARNTHTALEDPPRA